MNAGVYALEAKYEFLKHVRMPAYAIPSITFPVMFYLLFGVMFGGGRPAGGTTVATYLLATYSTFGVIGAALFGFGVGIAVERGQGWMTLKRATPMPPFAYFFAKVAMAVLFGGIIILLLAAVGMAFGGVRLPAGQWMMLALTLIIGAVPFCAIGLAVGYFAGPNSSVAIVNLIFMPMAFASGLWIPVEMLPPTVRAMSPLLPPYHLAQLALGTIGAGVGAPAWTHILTLAGFTALGLGVAWIGFRRDEDITWG
jgi:ABC-2 type transport system permease protein